MIVFKQVVLKILIIVSAIGASISSNKSKEFELSALGSKIIGGSTIPEDIIPFAVSVRFRDEHLCGGCLISDIHVLTAAHSISLLMYKFGYDKYRVKVPSAIEEDDKKLFDVICVDVNENFNVTHRKGYSDIAVLTLNRKVILKNNAPVAALPDKRTPDDIEAVIVGWGSIRTFNKYTGDPLLSNSLQKLKVLIIRNEKCQELYKKEYVIIHNQMCTISKSGTGVSWGDSGGPLLRGRLVLGIASFGALNTTEYPVIYTRVHSFPKYIEEAQKRGEKAFMDYQENNSKFIYYPDYILKPCANNSIHSSDNDIKTFVMRDFFRNMDQRT